MLQILNSTRDDIGTIFNLYDAAIAFQKIKFNKHWLGFDASLIEREVDESRQFKLVAGETVVCIFAITFNDALIWGEHEKSPAVYIHRIVTHPAYHGNGYVKNIVQWAVQYARENGSAFVRMDTWGDNQKLIDYYTNCGFRFIGLSHVIQDDTLPRHYQGNRLSLFEIAVEDHQPPA